MNNNLSNIGWPAYIGIGIVFFISISYGGFFSMLMYTILSFAGAIGGNFIRIHGMPDSYFTDGTAWGGFKAKFYWMYGPQWFGAVVTPGVLAVTLLYSGFYSN